jgi:hypothetical protein
MHTPSLVGEIVSGGKYPSTMTSAVAAHATAQHDKADLGRPDHVDSRQRRELVERIAQFFQARIGAGAHELLTPRRRRLCRRILREFAMPAFLSELYGAARRCADRAAQ